MVIFSYLTTFKIKNSKIEATFFSFLGPRFKDILYIKTVSRCKHFFLIGRLL